jgi:long-chain fatty acid transport protein
MTLEGRGARPLGRAGSFVAGADDGSAMVYNPAGLVDVDDISVLADVGMVFQRTHYERVDSGGNPQPAVDGDLNYLPFPTAVVTWKPRTLNWITFHAGVWVPYLGLNSYPETGPQRYSSITLNGSLVAVPQLGASFRLHPHVWLGAGFQLMFLQFKSRVVLSACSELNCAPEDPGFDALTELKATGVAPSGIVGAVFPWPKFRIGLALQLPFFINAEGTVNSRLPSDPFFANASLVGDSITLSFTLPPMLRAGFEWRPLPVLRVELGVDFEAWSVQRNFTIQPHGIYIDGVPGVGRYYLNTMQVVRDMSDTISLHLGGEWEAIQRRLVVRAGYLLETSAFLDDAKGQNAMSVLTSDGLKNMLTLGLGVKLGRTRLDVGYAHIFYNDTNVTNSKSLQLNPIQPSLAVPVGNGLYKISTDIVSVGIDVRL